MSKLKRVAEAGTGVLYESNGFLVPVLAGSPAEMGSQYGSLMHEHMQTAYDVLVAPGVESGAISDADIMAVTHRAMSTFSVRNRRFYDGVADATGWSHEKIGILDQYMEYGMYQAALHSFAGCTTILAWGRSSSDGRMYIGRNEDWSETFLEFPQVLTVRKPTDGSYRYATLGWPGMYWAITALNELGVYLDLHDGSSMGGSVVYVDRVPILGLLSDYIAESPSLEAVVRRVNTIACSASNILSLADESEGASAECSSLGGTRVRRSDGDSLVVVNSFMDPSWGLGLRDTVSHSLERFRNMTDRIAENAGVIDAAKTREIMDLPCFREDGSLGTGCTKPTKVDSDLTVHQVVTDVAARKLWLKVPSPDHFADWTEFDLDELWS